MFIVELLISIKDCVDIIDFKLIIIIILRAIFIKSNILDYF